MLSTTSPAAAGTVTDLLLVDTDIAAAMYGPALREKYRVHAAGTWEAALRVLTGTQPALVVTELGLGGTWGVDVCRHAKALPTPSTVLVITSDVTRVPDALEAGCDGVLLKPFAPNLLHARIGRLLRGRMAARQHPQGRDAKSSNGNGNGHAEPAGTNRVWPHITCPSCNHEGVTCFEFSSHRRSWYACPHCKHVWIGQRQE